MKKFLLCVPILALIAFELIVGINLFNDPVTFTLNAIVVFGVFMLVLAVLGLIRWLKTRDTVRFSSLTLAGVIVDLLIGILCIVRSDIVLGIFPVLAMFYGIVMVIMGIYKIRNYITIRSLGFHRPFIVLLSGILTIMLGIVIFLNPFTAVEALWQYIGIVMIVEAAMDLVSLIFGMIIL